MTVDGESASGHQSTTYNGTLLGDSVTYTFVPKLWARMRINALLNMMSKEQGQTDVWKEWRAEIIRLGRTYGIMTPFTTFTSSTGDPTDPSTTTVCDYPVDSHPVRIYPNPVKTTATIEVNVDVPTDRIALEIINIEGRVLGSIILQGSYKGLVKLLMDLNAICPEGLVPGVYHLRITMGSVVTIAMFTVVR